MTNNKRNKLSSVATVKRTKKSPVKSSNHVRIAELTPTRNVAVAIIGAGTAGQTAFKLIREATDSCVIIDAGLWTTTCATVGCMPSKLLIAAAERAEMAQHSQAYGVMSQGHIDGKQVMRHLQQQRNAFTQPIEQQVDGWASHQKITGKATIIGFSATGEALIKVNKELIACRHLIIATGSKPSVPPAWQKAIGKRLLTSDTVFELSDLPSSLAVIGAGAIGLELAQAMAQLGVKVTLLNASKKVAGLTDVKVNHAAVNALNQTQGNLTLALDSKITTITASKVADNSKTVTVHYQDKPGDNHRLSVAYVLAAMGRQSRLRQLGIENLGIVLDKQQHPTQINTQTGQIGELPVYIVGDANGKLPLLHMAGFEGQATAQAIIANLVSNNATTKSAKRTKKSKIDTQAMPRPVDLSIVFCQPQIAQVGMSYAQLKAKRHASKSGKSKKKSWDFVVGEVDFSDQGRSKIIGQNKGTLRVYAERATGLILGAAMVAPDAEYLAHLLALAITQQMTVNQLLAMPFYHPTIVEALKTALQSVAFHG